MTFMLQILQRKIIFLEQAAQKIAGRDNVYRAIDLVAFDPRLRPAMEFIFGNALICTDSNMAKEVRFHLSVNSFSTVNKTLMRNID